MSSRRYSYLPNSLHLLVAALWENTLAKNTCPMINVFFISTSSTSSPVLNSHAKNHLHLSLHLLNRQDNALKNILHSSKPAKDNCCKSKCCFDNDSKFLEHKRNRIKLSPRKKMLYHYLLSLPSRERNSQASSPAPLAVGWVGRQSLGSRRPGNSWGDARGKGGGRQLLRF